MSKKISILALFLSPLLMSLVSACNRNMGPIVTPTLIPPVPTSTPTVTACVTLGTHLPVPVTTWGIPPGYYEANVYPAGAACGVSFSAMQVYAGHIYTANDVFNVAVYDNSQQVASGTVTLTSANPYDGSWVSVPLTPFSIACGDQVILAFNCISGNVFLGVASEGTSCDADSGNPVSPMPATYPDPGILSTPNPGWCWEMNLTSCATGP